MVAKRKYSLDMDEGLMSRVEAYSNELHVSRNAAISVLVSQALDARKVMGTLDEFMAAYKLEAAKKALDEAVQK